jgi:hypothetical protein
MPNQASRSMFDHDQGCPIFKTTPVSHNLYPEDNAADEPPATIA